MPGIGIRPAEEIALGNVREVIRHETVTQAVALVHRDIKRVGSRIEGDADRIAQTGRECLQMAVCRDFLHRRTRVGILGDIVLATDSNIKRTIRSEDGVARPMTAGSAEAILGDPCALAGFQGAVGVRNAPNRDRVAHIKRAAMERQAVRTLEARRERIGLSVMNDCDLVQRRFADEDVAIGRQRHEARIRQARREYRHREAFRNFGNGVLRPRDHGGRIGDGRRRIGLGQIRRRQQMLGAGMVARVSRRAQ